MSQHARYWWVLAFGLGGVPLAALAADMPADTALLSADSVSYDKNSNTYTAHGNAELVHGQRTIQADDMQYTAAPDGAPDDAPSHIAMQDNVVVSQGDDSLAVRASTWQSDGALSKGTLTDVQARLGKTVRLAAKKIDFNRDATSILNNVTYTPCGVCAWADAPLWQVRSQVIENDSVAGITTHTNPKFDILGVPVLGLPYLVHAAPNVKRRSGVLPPSLITNRDNGIGVRVPYFFDLAPEKDVTLTTSLYSKVYPLMDAQYRQRFAQSALAVRGYGTYSDVIRDTGSAAQKDWRGALAGRLVGSTSDATYDADVMRASDDTFLRRYNISNARALHSRFNYTATPSDNTQYFIAGDTVQSMVDGDNDRTIPILLPLVESKTALGTDALGMKREARASFAALNRLEGRDVQRVSGTIRGEKDLGEWQGAHFTLFDDWRVDGYRYTAGTLTNGAAGSASAGDAARLLPAVGARGRLPIYGQHSNGWADVLELTAEGIVAPNGGNRANIPNEDTMTTALDSMSLFGIRRLYGMDIAETGTRMNLGIVHNITQRSFGTAQWSVGQTYRLKPEHTLDIYGLGDTRSDYTLRASYESPDGWRLWQSMRADRDSLAIKNATSALEGRYGKTSGTVAYSKARAGIDANQLAGYQDLGVSMGRQVTQAWNVRVSQQNNLQTRQLLERRLTATYIDECLHSDIFVARNYTTDRDVSSGLTFGLMVQLIPIAADAVPIVKSFDAGL